MFKNRPGIRYYMGRHAIQIMKCYGKKSIIQHLQCGKVGNKRCGYKDVYIGEVDIVPTRLCYIKKNTK